MQAEEKVVHDVIEQLGVLEPTADDAPQPVHQAFAHLQQGLAQQQLRQPASRRRSLSQGNWPSRLGHLFNSQGSTEMSKRKGWMVGLVSVLVLAVLFSMPSVRAAASDFLGLFRVQKFAAVSISPERLALLQQLADQGLTPGEFEVNNEPGAETALDSLDEGAAQTGITVRTITALGEPGEIYLVDGGDGRLVVDLEGARAIMEAAGADPLLLPDNLDGERVFVAVFDAVRQVWSDGTELIQAESPYAEYPDNVDPTVLGEALLQVLGVAPESAHTMAQSIDWTTTFLLPIPQGTASFSEVTVDGVTGAAMASLDGQGNGLLWEKDGKVHLLTGQKSIDELLSLADSLR